MSFDDRESYQRWASSLEYQKISKARLASTEGVVLVVDGASGSQPTVST